MAGITVPRETSLVGTHLLDRRAGRTLSLASIAHNPANLAPFSNSSPQLCLTEAWYEHEEEHEGEGTRAGAPPGGRGTARQRW